MPGSPRWPCTGGTTIPATRGSTGGSSGKPAAAGGSGRHLVTSHKASGALKVVAGALPPGLSLTSTFGASGAVVGGTGTQLGSFAFTMRVTDYGGQQATQRFTLAIQP